MTEADSPTSQKRKRAEAYLQRLGTRGILFSGICGSVSYEAREDDDIDVFVITPSNRLWSTLARLILLRRLHGDNDICLSLTMDSHHAKALFGGEGDELFAADALHVIPIHGKEYYASLLENSPAIARYFPGSAPGAEPGRVRQGTVDEAEPGYTLVEVIAFALLAPFLGAKSMVANRSFARRFGPERGFRVMLSPHYFYLDTVKYQSLRGRPMAAPMAKQHYTRTT